jgi:hypothetical protein
MDCHDKLNHYKCSNCYHRSQHQQRDHYHPPPPYCTSPYKVLDVGKVKF